MDDITKNMLEKGFTFSGATSFARLPYTRELQDVSVAIVGIPFDLATSNRPGARFGPRGIREISIFASKALQFGFGQWPWDHNPLETHQVIDYGDITYLLGSQESMLKEVEHHLSLMLEAGVSPLIFGGDHFISYPVLEAFGKKYKNMSLIHFDSHTDTYPTNPKTHGCMFYDTAVEGIIDPEKSVQIGIRFPYLPDLKYHILDANRIQEEGPDKIAEAVKRIVGNNPAYLTFDIDFLDPAYAPGTGTPEIGGPTTYFARRLLRGLSGLNIVGADIVEVSPPYDSAGQITTLAAAQLAVDILYLLCAARPKL